MAARTQSGLIARALANMRAGRMQRLLAGVTAVSAPPLAFEIYLEHYKASFGDKWMWTPIVLTPPLVAAGVAGVFSERAAKTVLPAVSALYCLDGVIGMVTHVRGVLQEARRARRAALQPRDGAAPAGAWGARDGRGVRVAGAPDEARKLSRAEGLSCIAPPPQGAR